MTTATTRLNRTPDGGLACAFGTPWLDHFGAPIGNGRGCAACDAWSEETDANTDEEGSGTVCADGADIVSAGYEQNYYQQMTIQSADVNAGKVLIFAFRQDSANSDYSIQATIKYHLR